MENIWDEAAVHARLARDPASLHMGIQVTSISLEQVALELTPQSWMLNGHSILHGAVLFWLGDTAFAFLSEAKGHPSVTRQADITFIAPLTDAGILRAVATQKARFGRNSIVDVDLIDDAEQLVGRMTVHGTSAPPNPDTRKREKE